MVPIAMDFHSTPPQLFEDFEANRISREQLHAALAWHARELVGEIIEFHENPHAAWWETMLARRAAARWANRQGAWRLRHILFALSKLPDFEPARFLWNALHRDVPLHCFFRLRTRPVFRLRNIENRRGLVHVEAEFDGENATRHRKWFVLEHDGQTFTAHLKARR